MARQIPKDPRNIRVRSPRRDPRRVRVGSPLAPVGGALGLPAVGQTTLGTARFASDTTDTARLAREAEARRARSLRHTQAARRRTANAQSRNAARYEASRGGLPFIDGPMGTRRVMGALPGPAGARRASRVAAGVRKFATPKRMMIGAAAGLAINGIGKRSGRPTDRTNYRTSRGIYGY